MVFKTRLLLTFDSGLAGDHSCREEGAEEAREGVVCSAADQQSQDLNLGLLPLNSGWWHLTLVVWGTRAWELGSESLGFRSRLLTHSLFILSGCFFFYLFVF